MANVQVVVNHPLVIAPGTMEGSTIIERIEGKTFHHSTTANHSSFIDNDVVFTVKEIPHETYERVGNNLVHRPISISFDEALSGFMFNVIHVDGRVLRVQCDEVITPTTEYILEGEGMPMQMGMKKNDNKVFFFLTSLIGKGHGYMSFTFNIIFPSIITGQISLDVDVRHLHSKKEKASCPIQ